jgi:ABC-type spermidine/putrescine transport system permease subunit II
MVVFSSLRLGATPALAAVATLVLATLVLTLLAAMLLRRFAAPGGR